MLCLLVSMAVSEICYNKHHLSCCASVQYKFGVFCVCLFLLSCCTAQFVGSLNPDQGLNPDHSSESFKSYPLDCQGIPRSYFLLISKSSVGLQGLCSTQLKREPGSFLPIVSPFLITLSSSEFQMSETGNRLSKEKTALLLSTFHWLDSKSVTWPYLFRKLRNLVYQYTQKKEDSRYWWAFQATARVLPVLKYLFTPFGS